MNQLGTIDVHGLTIRGDTRERNHDHFAIAALSKAMKVRQTTLGFEDDARIQGRTQGHVFVVADGVSGGPQPARASSVALDGLVRYFLDEMPWYHLQGGQQEDVELALADAMRNAQEELLRRAGAGAERMATTLTLAFVNWPDLYVAHVGDSRCYLRRDGRLQRLTTDHTLARLALEAGKSPGRRAANMLWNAIGGPDPELRPEVSHVRLRVGDVLALVTDGVLEAEVDERRLGTHLGAGDSTAEDMCSALVRLHGRDDRTAVVARFLPRREVASPAAGELPGPSLDHHARGPARRPRSRSRAGCGTRRRLSGPAA